MVLASTTTKRPKILIGRSGSDRSFRPLADGLRREGLTVTERASAAVGAHSTNRAAEDVVDQFDMVFLVVRAADASNGPGAALPFQQVLREAGVIQGKMDMDRVVLLVEESVVGLSPDTGVSYIRFPTGQPEAVLSEVLHKIGTTFPEAERDLHERIPISRQARSAELRYPWVLVAVVLALALLAIVILARLLAGGDDDAAETEAVETTQISGVAASLRDDQQSIFAGRDQAAQPGTGEDTEAAPSTPAAPSGQESADPSGSGSGDVSEPAAPAVTLDGANQLLPATCALDLRKGSLLDGAINCTGAGALVLEGRAGPWHNELVAVAVSEGVVGTLEYELRSDGSTVGPSVIELTDGTVGLNEADAAFGVNTITLRFSANNQHVHLFQAPDDGGESATLTFTLDG